MKMAECDLGQKRENVKTRRWNVTYARLCYSLTDCKTEWNMKFRQYFYLWQQFQSNEWMSIKKIEK